MDFNIKDLLGLRKRITTGVDYSDLVKFASQMGYSVTRDPSGTLVPVPRDTGPQTDILSLTEQYGSLSNIEPAAAQNREVRFRTYDRMDSQGGEGVIVLNTYADEVVYSSSNSKEPIKIQVTDNSLLPKIRQCLEVNSIMSSVREDVRSIAKYGDMAYCVLPRYGVNLMQLTGDSDKDMKNLSTVTKIAVPLRPEDLVIRPIPSPQYDLVGLSNIVYQLKIKEESIQFRQMYSQTTFLPWEFALFSIKSRDTFPYGLSKLEPLRNPWEQLAVVEQLLAITRANRIDKINVAVPVGASDVMTSLRKLTNVRSFLKTIMLGAGAPGGMFGSRMTRNQSAPMTEYLFTPDTFKVDRLSTSLEIGGIEDVEYFRDKVINTSCIPKAFFLADGTDTRPGSLHQQDLRFARTIQPISEAYCKGLEGLITLIAFYLGADMSKFRVKVSMTPAPYVSQELLETFERVLGCYDTYISLKQKINPDYKPSDEDMRQLLGIMDLPQELFFREDVDAPIQRDKNSPSYLMEHIIGRQLLEDIKEGDQNALNSLLIDESVMKKHYDNIMNRLIRGSDEV